MLTKVDGLLEAAEMATHAMPRTPAEAIGVVIDEAREHLLEPRQFLEEMDKKKA